MSDEDQEHEEDSTEEESLELVEIDKEAEADELDELDELEVDESDEMDEVDEVVEEKVPEKGAYLVIGQGDFSTVMSNRGADDPGDNTLPLRTLFANLGICYLSLTGGITVFWFGINSRRNMANLPTLFSVRKTLRIAWKTEGFPRLSMK